MLLMTFKCQSFHESRYRVFPLSMAFIGGGGVTRPTLHLPGTLSIYVLFSIRTPQFYSVILPYPKCIGVDQNNHKNFSFRINEMMM